jgi:succinyl-diaminopimelate desuccinylase
MVSDLTSYFDSQELIRIAQRLIQIPSENPSGNEEKVALCIKDILVENGIASELSWAAPERPNLMATLQGSLPGPTMIYNGHLDVVPAGPKWTKDPYAGIIENGKLYGRGASDMKSGVAAMLYAAIVLKRTGTPFKGKLILLFNVDEEYSNIGIKHFLQQDIQADYVVISEPSDMDVCICNKGAGRYRLHTFGISGHTSVVENPDNSIYKMAKLIVALEQLSIKIKQRSHEMLGTASLTVAQVNGGSAPNIVPNHTQIEIDRRVLPGEEETEVYKEIELTVKEIAVRDGFDIQMEQYLYVPPHSIEKDHILTQTALRVTSEIAKKDKVTKTFFATTEASFFSVNKRIPTIIMGPGSLHQAHKEDESVDLQEVIDASKVYIQLAIQLLTA